MSGGSAPAGTIIDGGFAGSLGNNSFPFPNVLLRSNDTGTGPKAYLNYLVFNRNFQSVGGGFIRLTTAAMESGANTGHERLAFDGSSEILIKEAGYVYTWLSNENDTPVEVYFDDFKVTHIKSTVVQQDDYYPFGLTFNSYQRENATPNKWKFQGQEHTDDLGLNWDSFKWRNHQPDIGRFFNIDPLANKYVYNSPYAFSENRVTDGKELEGLEWVPVNGQGNQVTPTSSQVVSYNWVGYTNVTTPTGAPYASQTPETLFSYAPQGTVSERAVMGTQNGVTGATFYSVDQNQQGATEFSALSGSVMEFNGAMNGTRAEGTLTLTNEYENGKTIDAVSQTANSGPWGNGSLPNGNYSADGVVSPTYNAGMVVGANDFAIHLTPNFQTSRSGLYIHPDGGNYVGTQGCVGLTGTANQMQSLHTMFQTILGTQGAIQTTVNINGNPNNQGGNNNNNNQRRE